jgi:ankyrin repeat protein
VTALMLALDNDHNDVARLLLDRGANPRVWDWWGRTALYIAIDRKETLRAAARRARPPVSSMDIVNALLGAEIDGVEINAQLNMHRPSRSGNSGRFIDPLLNIGCTPLLRATMSGDADVVRALLAKGAYPNINAMGLTPFLVAAGVGAGNRGGTGLAAQTSAGGPVNMELMELLLQHGANVNDQVTGTLTYSMRVSRAPSANEGRTALHIAAQEGKTDLVRYLLSKGANPEITDAGGLKAIDLVGSAAQNASTPAGAPASGAANPASAAEIRGLLQSAASKK